jgi:hypothetical protein
MPPLYSDGGLAVCPADAEPDGLQTNTSRVPGFSLSRIEETAAYRFRR